MSDNIHGFSIPFRIDRATGGVAVASGADKLEENIVHVLLTRVGERVMRRRYGGGLQQLVQDPDDQTLRVLLEHQIARSLGEHEPRILLQQIDVGQRDGMTIVDLRYLVRRIGVPQTMSVPIGPGVL